MGDPKEDKNDRDGAGRRKRTRGVSRKRATRWREQKQDRAWDSDEMNWRDSQRMQHVRYVMFYCKGMSSQD